MTPSELLDVVRRSWSQGNYDDVLGMVEAEWHMISTRSGQPEDAETCRLAMITAAERKRYSAYVVWQSRALARFVALDWHEGAAAVMMPNAFRLLAMANDNYPNGKTYDVLRPAPEALLVLEDLMSFCEGPERGFECGPTPELIARFVHEKSGFLLAIERRWDDSVAAYDRALAYAADESRGQVKVPLGRALVSYLSQRDAGRDGQEGADVTARLAVDPRTLAHQDLSQTAQANLERMRAGRFDLIPYEIL
jgi:hypothetical protein